MEDVAKNRLDVILTCALLALGTLPCRPMAKVTDALKNPGLNLADTSRMERGYYESLISEGARLSDAANPGALLKNDLTGAPSGERIAIQAAGGFENRPCMMRVDDLRECVLKPNYREQTKHGAWNTNSWGLRDREYERRKPPDTLRIVLLGDSIGAGWGVDDGQCFEARLETQLDESSRASHGPRVEILNLSVPGFAPGQRWEHFLRLDGWELEPDLVLYEATPADVGWDARRLSILLPSGLAWDAPQYRETLLMLGTEHSPRPEALGRLLRSKRWVLLENVYRTVAQSCRARGVTSVFALVPRVGKTLDQGDVLRLIDMARGAGFTHVIDLSTAFDRLEAQELAVSTDDYHPNAIGHARLAENLRAQLMAYPSLLAIRSRARFAADPKSHAIWPSQCTGDRP